MCQNIYPSFPESDKKHETIDQKLASLFVNGGFAITVESVVNENKTMCEKVIKLEPPLNRRK
jgi:hypothetical protein